MAYDKDDLAFELNDMMALKRLKWGCCCKTKEILLTELSNYTVFI